MFSTDELKILVVDDEKGNIEVLQSILKDHYGIIPALNGQKALELAQKHEPDLILLDIMMPGMDGYEVCKRLKNDPALAMIPVIFVTAMSEEEDEARGLQLGAVDYITKPVSPHIVRARVAIHIRLISAEQSLKIMDMVLGGARWWVLDPLRTVSRIIKGSVFEQEVKKSLRKVLKVLEQGRLHLKLQEVHFEKEVLDLRKLLTILLAEHEWRMYFEKGLFDHLDGSAYAMGDWEKLKEALSILRDNAITRSPKGEKIRVELCGDEQTVIIGFADYGEPIPGAEIPHIFNPFPNTEAIGKHGRTSDLALANAAVIATRHGGEVSCKSTDKVTHFSVRLPRRMED